MNDEEMKKNVKGCCSLDGDYPILEIVEALLMNDSEKLTEMRNRCIQLRAAYDKFVEDVDGPDEDARRIAISSFKRPLK